MSGASSDESYGADERRVKREVWGTAQGLQPHIVVDIGVGGSTRVLEEQYPQAYIVALDLLACRLRHEKRTSPRIDYVQANAAHLPIRPRAASLAVLYFTLHEANPNNHEKIIAEAARAATAILLAEPTPPTNPAHKLLQQVVKEAHRAIGLHEDYYEPSYWRKLLKNTGLSVAVEKLVEWKTPVPPDTLARLLARLERELKELGAPPRTLNKLRRVLEEARKTPLKWSKIYVALAQGMPQKPRNSLTHAAPTRFLLVGRR